MKGEVEEDEGEGDDEAAGLKHLTRSQLPSVVKITTCTCSHNTGIKSSEHSGDEIFQVLITLAMKVPTPRCDILNSRISPQN